VCLNTERMKGENGCVTLGGECVVDIIWMRRFSVCEWGDGVVFCDVNVVEMVDMVWCEEGVVSKNIGDSLSGRKSLAWGFT
jgi:hypothetical protein